MDGEGKLGVSRLKNTGNAGAGRRKGSKNKLTVHLKQAIEAAFDEIGGKEWLKTLATTDPRGFSMLLAKLIPSEIRADVDIEENDRPPYGVIVVPAQLTVEEWMDKYAPSRQITKVTPDEQTPELN